MKARTQLEVEDTQNGEFIVRLRFANSRKAMTSETYTRHGDAMRAAKSMRAQMNADLPIIDKVKAVAT